MFLVSCLVCQSWFGCRPEWTLSLLVLGVHRNKCLEAVFSQATSSVLIPRTTLYLRTHQPVPATQPVPPRYILVAASVLLIEL